MHVCFCLSIYLSVYVTGTSGGAEPGGQHYPRHREQDGGVQGSASPGRGKILEQERQPVVCHVCAHLLTVGCEQSTAQHSYSYIVNLSTL